jgi:hypothetical protein
MLQYHFALSHNAFILSRIGIASNSYRSEHIGPVMASYGYRFYVIDKRYRNYLLSLLEKIAFKSKYKMTLFYFSREKYIEK